MIYLHKIKEWNRNIKQIQPIVIKAIIAAFRKFRLSKDLKYFIIKWKLKKNKKWKKKG